MLHVVVASLAKGFVPVIAAGAMAFSSVSVVGNALLMKGLVK